MAYDSTLDTLKHKQLVNRFLQPIIHDLLDRAQWHDESKLTSPEKEMYDEIKPKIQAVEDEFGYGSPEYENIIKELNVALTGHFSRNSHHPEFFENGINDMNLLDLTEMVCDWKAAALRNNKNVDWETNAKRFGISPQLLQILKNTSEEYTF